MVPGAELLVVGPGQAHQEDVLLTSGLGGRAGQVDPHPLEVVPVTFEGPNINLLIDPAQVDPHFLEVVLVTLEGPRIDLLLNPLVLEAVVLSWCWVLSCLVPGAELRVVGWPIVNIQPTLMQWAVRKGGGLTYGDSRSSSGIHNDVFTCLLEHLIQCT